MHHRATDDKDALTLTGDERQGYELSVEKGPTTTNNVHNQWRGSV